MISSATLAPTHGGACIPNLWLYRRQTLALLRRYFRLSVEVGRLPSILGREFFRARVTRYRVTTLEDTVIFVHDVEQTLERLDPFEQQLIAAIVLRDYSQDEAADRLGCWRRTVGRRYPEALDRLSAWFLKGGLLNPLPAEFSKRENACQEGGIDDSSVSDSANSK